MGLVAGFVLGLNRRGVLAILAIAVSMAYTLVAGAAAGGLKSAQEVLGERLSESQVFVSREDQAPFPLASLPTTPSSALATVQVGSMTYYTIRRGPPLIEDSGKVLVAPASVLKSGQTLQLGNSSFRVEEHAGIPGALATWVGVDEALFAQVGGPPPPLAHVAIFPRLDAGSQKQLVGEGFLVFPAPAAYGFYTRGAQEIVSVLRLTVAASAIVVGFLTGTLVQLEVNSRRSSLATLQLFVGRRVVKELLVARVLLILALGIGLALVATFGAVALLRRGGLSNLYLPGSFVSWAIPVVGAGGIVGLVWTLRRATRRLRIEDIQAGRPVVGPSWARGFLLTSWRMTIPLAVSAIILAGSLSVNLGVIEMPNQLFGVSSDAVVADLHGNPLRGGVPLFFGEHLSEVPGFLAASPEIFGPTVIEGRPAIVRGVDWSLLSKLDRVRILEGRPPAALGEAVFGQRLAEKLDADVGSSYWVPSPYLSAALAVKVVGIAKAPGILADEALVSLESARALTGLPRDEVNIVRIALNTSFVARTPLSIPNDVVVAELELRPPVPVANETAEVAVRVLNFASEPRSHRLTLRVNEQVVAETNVVVDGYREHVERYPFRVPSAGLLTLKVNPTLVVDPERPAYDVSSPSPVVVNAALTIRVLTASGEPAQNVNVGLDSASSATDSTGHVVLVPTQVGNRTILVDGPAGRGAEPVLVVFEQDLDQPRLVVRAVDGPTRQPVGTWSGTVLVENLGGRTFQGSLPLLVNGTTRNMTEVTIPPGVTQRVAITLDLAKGGHNIGPPDLALHVEAFDPAEEKPAPTEPPPEREQKSEIERLLDRRRAQRPPALASSSDAIVGFLGDTYENLNAAVTIVTLATFLHAALIIFITIHREVEERGPTIGTMAALGGSRGSLRTRAALEYAIVGIAGALGGTFFGIGMAWGASAAGFLQGFGHTLSPHANLVFELRVAATSLATSLAAAALAVDSVRNQNLRRLLAPGPSRIERPPLEKLIGESA